MGVLLFLFGTALATGLYFVLADLLKIPRLATERALISAGRRERSLGKALEALIIGWALKLAPLIRMDEYKYRRLESKLTAAGLPLEDGALTGAAEFLSALRKEDPGAFLQERPKVKVAVAAAPGGCGERSALRKAFGI